MNSVYFGPAPKDFTIIWISNILHLSVPDEGFSRILSCISVVIKHKLHLMLIVVDETFAADLIMSVTNDNM